MLYMGLSIYRQGSLNGEYSRINSHDDPMSSSLTRNTVSILEETTLTDNATLLRLLLLLVIQNIQIIFK